MDSSTRQSALKKPLDFQWLIFYGFSLTMQLCGSLGEKMYNQKL